MNTPRFNNIQIGDSGAFFGMEGANNFSANFPLFLISEAWQRDCNFEDLADGFGVGLGTAGGDWSGIRDSSDYAKAQMLERALNHLFPRPNEPHIDAIDRARGHGEEPEVDNRGAPTSARTVKLAVTARVDVDPDIAWIAASLIDNATVEAIRNAVEAGEANGFTHKLDDFLAIEIVDVSLVTEEAK